jgi:hypothetical protein
VQSRGAVSKPALDPLDQSPVQQLEPLKHDPVGPVREVSNDNPIQLSKNHVEDMVLKIDRSSATANEQAEGVNSAISKSSLADGEIDIDRQGLIHHPADEEKNLDNN